MKQVPRSALSMEHLGLVPHDRGVIWASGVSVSFSAPCPGGTSLSGADAFTHTSTHCVGSLWSLESGSLMGSDTEGLS